MAVGRILDVVGSFDQALANSTSTCSSAPLGIHVIPLSMKGRGPVSSVNGPLVLNAETESSSDNNGLRVCLYDRP